ncbi:MAG: aminodeoxychorismate/anthranilate synthase component II [Halobacteriovoraceae bacterium]|nr:aminodeoxychorismate/anthranilate synthase component II [Halobacteriovoraceae bacterium]
MSNVNKVIMIDNFDSFSYNLVDQIRASNTLVDIYRNNIEMDVLDKAINSHLGKMALVLSPGPGNPQSAGNLLPIIDKYLGKIPMIGICLGHQALIQAYGGKVIKSNKVVHGKTSILNLSDHPLFRGLGKTETIGRYHSLQGSEIPCELDVLSSVDDIPMIVFDKKKKVIGFQFHPESIMTIHGKTFLSNALNFLFI